MIANQPLNNAGAVGNEASDKAAGFIRFCDSFNLPLVFVVDTPPGAMPGLEEEKGGIIKRGGRFFNAIVEADVPKVTFVIRKAYGGGYAVMGSKQLSADLNFAWPTARIAVIGAEGAAQLLVKRFPDPTSPEVQKIRADFIEGYNLNLATRGSPPSAVTSTGGSSNRTRRGCCCASRCSCCGTSRAATRCCASMV